MTNALTFIKNNTLVTSVDLNSLAADLNASGAETNYYFFVLNAIATKHHNVEVIKEAQRYLSKKQDIQDDLEYLNNCIQFLIRQLKKDTRPNALTNTEIAERKIGLTEDIRVFVEGNKVIQRACFRFTNEYFHTPFGQSNMAA